MNKERKVRCVNLQRNKKHYYSESTTKQKWFKKAGWMVQDSMYEDEIPEDNRIDLTHKGDILKFSFEDKDKFDCVVEFITELTENESSEPEAGEEVKAKDLVEIIKTADLATVEEHQNDPRKTVQAAVENRLKELAN